VAPGGIRLTCHRAEPLRSDAEPYSYEEVIQIIEAANEPFQTFLRILAESGMRPAEVCALDAKYVHLEDCVISVRQSESLGFIVTPKTATGYRDFAISVQLTEHLRNFIGERRDRLLFASKTGRPWRESKVVEKRLNPLLRKLGIKQKGLMCRKNKIPFRTINYVSLRLRSKLLESSSVGGKFN
jgi:integrase